MSALLTVTDLRVAFPRGKGLRREVVAGVDYSIEAGRTLGVVGESGCGKSMTSLALMGLVPSPGTVAGSIRFNGRELAGQGEAEWRRLRGESVAMIFQEPMTALNPVMQVGRQIAEVMVLHRDEGWKQAGEPAVALLDAVGINSPRERARSLSAPAVRRDAAARDDRDGAGLRAGAADRGRADHGARRHHPGADPGPDARPAGRASAWRSSSSATTSRWSREVAHEIIVMYAGRVVERASSEALFAQPLHPYTQGLIATLPNPEHRVARLPVIPGGVPDLVAPKGCRFADRCVRGDASCRQEEPVLEELEPGHFVACFKART